MSTCTEKEKETPSTSPTSATEVLETEEKTNQTNPVKTTDSAVQYSILFQNNHGTGARYIFFYGPPTIDDPSDPKVQTYVWQPVFVTNGGFARLVFNTDEFGWCSEIVTSAAGGANINEVESDYKEVMLGTATMPGSTLEMVIEDTVPSAPTLKDGNTPLGQIGSFAIETGTDFTLPNETYMIGTGCLSNWGDQPSQVRPTSAIKPSQKIYLASSKLPQGAPVDVDVFAQHAAVVDYSAWASQGYNTAYVEQGSNGAYTVAYRSQ
ncbi:hypothetical protein AA313_de0207639 [Arthrobotrys entomopaga]|nr:hypothetical protein AA313_de0207639 [Arthrobotrys entomopaga]